MHYVPFDDEDGRQVQFWHDSWCVDQPLKVLFLHLYACSIARDTSVYSLVVRHTDEEMELESQIS